MKGYPDETEDKDGMSAEMERRCNRVPYPEENEGATTLCGVQLNYFTWLRQWQRGAAYNLLLLIISELKDYQKTVVPRNSGDESALRAIFAMIDAEEKDPTAAHRKKIKAATESIDPIIFMQSLRDGMKEGDPFARKLYADVMGLGKEAAHDAKEGPAPNVQFNFSRAKEGK